MWKCRGETHVFEKGYIVQCGGYAGDGVICSYPSLSDDKIVKSWLTILCPDCYRKKGNTGYPMQPF